MKQVSKTSFEKNDIAHLTSISPSNYKTVDRISSLLTNHNCCNCQRRGLKTKWQQLPIGRPLDSLGPWVISATARVENVVNVISIKVERHQLKIRGRGGEKNVLVVGTLLSFAPRQSKAFKCLVQPNKQHALYLRFRCSLFKRVDFGNVLFLLEKIQ